MEEENAALVGRAVRKFFQGHGYYAGRVISYDRDHSFFRVEYADGDKEEMDLQELRRILINGAGGEPPVKRPRGRPKKVPGAVGRPRKGVGRPRKAEPGLKTPEGDQGDVIQVDSLVTVTSSKRPRDDDVGDQLNQPEQPRKKLRDEEPAEAEAEEEEVPRPPPHRRKTNVVEREYVKRTARQVTPAKAEASPSQELFRESVIETDLNVPPLPPASLSLGVPPESVLDLFSTYTFLRSFSWVLFLSPFPLSEFVRCLTLKHANALVDHIHLSLLLLLRQHLENLAKDGVESAIKCLKCRDWSLLDMVTWPSYLVTYLLNEDNSVEGNSMLSQAGVLNGEYYELEASHKIAILNFLCDSVLQTEEVRAELSERTNLDCEGDSPEAKTPACKSNPTEDRETERRTRSSRKDSPSDTSELLDPPVAEQEQKPAVDWNSDDCVLCKMDGNLICCDGCPGAYHTRCVGIARSSLPEGDWYCPECTFQKSAAEKSWPRKVLRGFETLDLDVHGRRYVAVCDHLFISASSHADSGYVCYGPLEVAGVLEVLESTGVVSASTRTIIMQHWKPLEEVSVKPEQIATPDTSCCVKNVADTEVKPLESGSLRKWSSRTGSQEVGAEAYVNQYASGASAALAASRLSERPGNRKVFVQRAQVFEQTKAFSKVPLLFQWPTHKRKEAAKDKCGWCFACKNLNKKRGCLLNAAMGKTLAGAAIVSGGLRPTRRGLNHLPALAAYVLYVEERLNGLLDGAWENTEHRKRWRKRIECAQQLSQVRSALKELGYSLRPLALTRDWSAYGEDAPRLIASSLEFVPPPRGRRRKYFPEVTEPIKAIVHWWRGGKVLRRFHDWESLPAAALKLAARQGGRKRVPGLLYSDNNDIPRRTAKCAWLARVESSFSVSELAIQVRYLDALIRWSDLAVPEEARLHMPESLIYEKAVIDGSIKYLVGSCKTEEELNEALNAGDTTSSPVTFVKTLLGEAKDCQHRVWLQERQMPVSLIREFEEKRRRELELATPKVTPGRKFSPHVELKISKTPKLRGLLYKMHLIAMEEERKKAAEAERERRKAAEAERERRKAAEAEREKKKAEAERERREAAEAERKRKKAVEAERMKLLKCEHCNLNLPIRDRVSCQECEGDFHRLCLQTMNSSEGPICQSCFAVKQSRRSRRMISKVVEAQAPLYEELELLPFKRREEKPLFVYSRRRKSTPACLATPNAFGPISRNKRSVRPRNLGVSWKIQKKLLLKRDRVLFPGHGRARGPECTICLQPYNSTLMYVGCEDCHEWVHGRAVGISQRNVARVASFKCHKCRSEAPPDCPYRSSSFIHS